MDLQSFRAVVSASVYTEFCPHWDNNHDVFTQSLSLFFGEGKNIPAGTFVFWLSH